MLNIKPATSINYSPNRLPFIVLKYPAKSKFQQTFNSLICFTFTCKAGAAYIRMEYSGSRSKKISNRERLDYKLSAFRILHTIPHVHSALCIPHSALHISAFYRYPANCMSTGSWSNSARKRTVSVSYQ